MSNSAQLERQADSTRRQLARTLEELRERITPGQLMDQVVDYAKDSGGGDFVRNFGRQVADNPLPVSLIGAGIAWLMLAKGRAGRAGDGVATAADNVSDAATTAYDATRDTAGSAYRATRERTAAAGEAAGQLSDTAATAYDAAKDSAASAYQSTRDSVAAAGGAISDTVSGGYRRMSQTGAEFSRTASSLGQQTADLTQSFLRFCTEQPLVLAGIGLAIGAAAGAALPATETENELMGEASDAAKERAKGMVQDQYEKGKEVVESAAQRAQEAAQEALDQPPATGASEHAEAKLVPDAGEEVPAQAPGEQHRGFVE